MAWYEPKTTKQEREKVRKEIESIPPHLRQYRGIAYTFWLNLLDDIEASEKLNKAFFEDNEMRAKHEAKAKEKQKPAVAPLPCEEMVLEEVYATENFVTHYETLHAPSHKRFNVKCQGSFQKARFVIVATGCTRDEFKHYEANVYANGMPVARFCEIPFVTDMDVVQMASKLLSWWMNKYVIKPYRELRAELDKHTEEVDQWQKLVRMKPNK